jgi:hypothetical protein
MDPGGLKIYGSAILVKGLPRYVSEPVLRKKKLKCKISTLNGMTKADHFEADVAETLRKIQANVGLHK